MTRKFLLIAGVAAMALTGPVAAERGSHARDTRAQASQGGEERKAQRTQRAERPQRAERTQRAERPQRIQRQQAQRAERQQRPERILRAERPQRIERQQVQRAERQQRPERILRAESQQRVERQRAQRVERPQRVERQRVQQAERQQRVERQRIQRVERPQRVERQRVQQAERQQRIERQRIQAQAAERIDRRQAVARETGFNFDRRLALREQRRARLNAQSSQQVAQLLNDRPIRRMTFNGDRRIIAVGDRINPARFSSLVPTVYRTRFVDTPDYYYRYDDDLGYLYRIDRDDNFVRALIPLFGGYGVGDPWPRTYYDSYVPLGYRASYYDTPNYYYRSDGYGIYQISAQTQLITALVGLLSGQGYGVGQMLPSNYGVYNVPLAYRSTYYDRNDAWYRYGDGFIYQVDPYSQRIAARYPLYGDSMNYLVGEPWPAAYPGYNVPHGYQSLYYDTPNYHYRYANGGIYQVDPTTQIIMGLAALVTGQPFAVGQPLPGGYGTYNVPLAYRDRYYDTNDAWYRYANGNVYRVDPVNRLIVDSVPIYV